MKPAQRLLTGLTLWQANSNPLWHCECSDPEQLHSAPSGIHNQSPHGSLTNHLSIPTLVICTYVEHQTGGIRTSLNMAEREVIALHSRLAITSSVWWPKRAVVVRLSRPSAPQMPKLSNVIHPWELLLLLLIHRRRFTGRWYWSVTQACAQEYHFPHQATVRRHQAQQHRTENDFDEWIF